MPVTALGLVYEGELAAVYYHFISKLIKISLYQTKSLVKQKQSLADYIPARLKSLVFVYYVYVVYRV